jgi:CRISPR/Cas system-associated exonuclease Cas4 (RecB family)
VILPETAQGRALTWSLSRHDTFTRCRRRYWLNYYLAFSNQEVARLKELSSLDLWVGSLVHDAIEVYLKTYHHTGDRKHMDPERIIRQVTHGQMPQDWSFSLIGNKRFRLFEHEYGIDVSADDKKMRVGMVVRALRNFFAGPILAEAIAVGRKNWLTIDEVKPYEIEGVTVNAALDFAYRRADGRVHIVDWKTGRSESRTSQIQIAGYALIALQQGWAKVPEDIDATLSYLALGTDKTKTMTEAIIDKARSTIKASAQAMRDAVADPALNIGRRDDFPLTTSQWDCKRCAFKGICYPDTAPALVAA